MNEEVLKDLYDRAVSQGYTKSIEEFQELLNNNDDVLNDNYNHVKSQGYQKSIEDFSILVGVKKKDESDSISQEVVTESVTQTEQEEVISSDVSETIEEANPRDLKPKEINIVDESVQTDLGMKPLDFSGAEFEQGEEDTALERQFGKNFFTDFFGDMYRAGVQGQVQGGSLDEALALFSGGQDVSDEQIQEFIQAQEALANVPPSDEMKDFQKIYEENGGGVLGFTLGVANNMSVIPQLFVSSVSAMLNPASLAAGAATGAAGAGVGSVVPGIGTGAGAIGGFMAGAGGALETGLTFAELLQEEVDGELTKESIREVLEDEDAYNRIRNKSLARGLTIAAIEGLTGGIAGKVTSKVVGLTGRKLAGTVAGIGVESVGGSLGEVGGRLAAGQEMDVAEIGFEGIAGTATAPLSVGYGLYKSPKYSINKTKNGDLAKVSGPDMAKFIRTATPEQILKTEVTIENDSELQKIYDDKFKEASVENEIQQADPSMNEPTRKAITKLQLQLNELQGNESQVAKDKASKIRAEIKELQDNPLTEETDAIQESSTETVDVQEQTGVSETVGVGDTKVSESTTETTQEEVQEQAVLEDVQSEIESLEQQQVEELEALSFDEVTQMKLDAVKKRDKARYKRELINAAKKSAKGLKILNTYDAKRKLADPNATISERVMAKKFLEDGGAYSPAELSQIEKTINKIKNKELLSQYDNQVAAYYNAEVQEQTTKNKTTQESEIESLEQALPQEAKDNVDAQLQLDTDVTPQKKKDALVDEAVQMMDDVENQNKLEEQAFDATNPAPEVKPTQIEVKENTDLAAKVKRMGLKELIGKKVNLIMADQLKVGGVDIAGKVLKRMGGPLFPMIDGLFGKIGWASINETAARKIINGAINSDFTVVYNMKPTAVDSNVAILETFVESVKGLNESSQVEVFDLMQSKLQELKFGKATEKVNNIAKQAKNINELMNLIDSLDVDTKADIMTKIVPSRDVKAGTQLGVILQDNKITIEDIRDMNTEQFAANLPAGAMTTVIQITDKNGNPITKETANEAIVTREQQKQEGLPEHQNYPVYIRGKAIGLLNETVPFWNMFKTSMSSLNAKVAGIVKKKVPATDTKPASERKITSKEALAQEMRSASMTASQSKKLSSPQTSTYTKFVGLLKRSFPNVEVVTSQKEFDALLKDLNAKALSTKGQRVYGAVMGGKLYLNPGLENFNTPIHEFGHIWLNVAKEAKPALFKKGMQLIKGTSYETQVRQSQEYQRVIKQMQKEGATQAEIDTYILEEALATAIGDQGEAFVNAAQKRNFKNWLNDLYSFVRTMTGLSQYTPAQLENITLSEFLQGVNVDLLSGNEVFAQAEAKGLSDALQLMTDSSKPEVKSFVEKARALGYSDTAIQAVLKKRGYDANIISEVIADKKAATKVKVTEDLVPGIDRLKSEIDGIIQKSKERGVKFNKIIDNVIKYVKGSRVYETATDNVREQLIRDIRNEFNLKENTSPSVSKILGAIKDVKKITLRETELLKIRMQEAVKAAKGAKDFAKKFKTQIANDLYALVDKGQITQRQAVVIAKRLAQVDINNQKSIDNFTEYVAKVFNDSTGKYKKSVIKDIVKFVKEKSKKAITDSNKARGKGLDAQGQAFFQSANKVLSAILSNEFNPQLIKETFFPDIQDILSKEGNLTVKEQAQLDAYTAFELLKGVEDMSVQEVEQLFQDLKNERSESISRLKDKIAKEKAELKELRDEADSNIQEGYSELFNEDGTPLNEEQRRGRKDSIRKAIFTSKFMSSIMEYAKKYNPSEPGSYLNAISNNLKNLATLTNSLDKVGKFFTDKVYNQLNRMESNYVKGLQKTRKKLDDIAKSIDGIESYNDIKKKLGSGVHIIKGITTGEGKTLFTDSFNADQLMRVYALSKNPIQRAKLLKQGFTDAKIEEIKKILGPEVVEFTDKVVDYLSTEYFEQTNDVYKDVNNVNLGFIENYFPTQTVQTNVDSKLLDDGDFSGIFNAQIAPALKERTDQTGDIKILSADFTSVIDNHFETIERYKAYAKGVKTLNALFNFNSVSTLLDETGMNKVIRNAVNFAVNPNGGQQAIQPTLIDKLMTKYTGFALAFKAVQIAKQATSFINAFEDYSYRGPGKKKIPGLDLVMFMIDHAVNIATLPIAIREMYNTSPMVRERLRQGLEGDVYGLESGSVTFKPLKKQSGLLGQAIRAFKTAAGFPTVAGDILGVMGYWANYKRDIANGMSKEKALEKFENYNATQQSRRPTDKIPLQMNSSAYTRAFTMFGSTLFLQINKVMQSYTNIMRSASKGKIPSVKDSRALILNLGAANVLFQLTANAFKYGKGDEEDKEEVVRIMKDAMSGLNLIYQVPFFGAAVESMVNKARGTRRPVDVAVNPLTSVISKAKKIAKDDRPVEAIVRTATELTIGAQADPFIGLYNGFSEGFDEEVMYDVLGVSSSYRPSDDTESNKKATEELKSTNPKTYDRIKRSRGSRNPRSKGRGSSGRGSSGRRGNRAK